MLYSVRFHGFKCLRDVELSGLQQLNVIVGPSGAGKSSVLQGLQLLASVVPHRDDTKTVPQRVLDAFGGRVGEQLMTSGETRMTLGCATSTGDALELEATRKGHKIDFRLSFAERDQPLQVVEILERSLGDLSTRLEMYFGQLRATASLKLDGERLGAVSPSSSHPSLEHDGSGLATVLAYFAGAYRDRLQSLESELRAVVGTTGQIRTFPDEIELEETEMIRLDEQLVPRSTRRKRAAHRFEVEVDGLGSVPGNLLSEGMLTTLGLLTVLHHPDCPRLLLLDDVDQGLHPDAQAKLVRVLRKLLGERPETQILCTSHSPYLIDHFLPEEVQVMSFVGGQATAARLDQHEEWPRWQGKLQTGEFWQSVGEDWVGDAGARQGSRP